MDTYQLERVFNESGFPEITFVKPKEYNYLKSSLKQKGKHITIAGPSGTGKTTLVQKLFDDLSIDQSDILWLNARQYSEHESGLQVLAEEVKCSTDFNELTQYLQLVQFIVIDDFHFFKTSARLEIAKQLKLWHEKDVRFVIIGIASSAEELHGVDQELGIRNDPFNIKTQDDTFCKNILSLGAEALNITFDDNLLTQIIQAANGVPSIVHVIGKVCCIEANIEETQQTNKIISNDLINIRDSVLRVFHGRFRDKVVGLAKGKQQARSVHNTYFDIVQNIALFDNSEIPKEALYQKIVAVITDPKQRSRKATSFYNCLNNLSDVIKEKGLEDILYFKKGGTHISIEDPSFRFYLNLLDINDIKDRIHLRNSEYPYDVAVSFAGDIRELVEKFVSELKTNGLNVFYDFDIQSQLWGKDTRQKLADIYANDALFMVVFLSNSYPERDWTDFELTIGKQTSLKRTEEYLLPIKVDDVAVVGLKSTIGYIDLNHIDYKKAAALLAEKVENSSFYKS